MAVNVAWTDVEDVAAGIKLYKWESFSVNLNTEPFETATVPVEPLVTAACFRYNVSSPTGGGSLLTKMTYPFTGNEVWIGRLNNPGSMDSNTSNGAWTSNGFGWWRTQGQDRLSLFAQDISLEFQTGTTGFFIQCYIWTIDLRKRPIL